MKMPESHPTGPLTNSTTIAIYSRYQTTAILSLPMTVATINKVAMSTTKRLPEFHLVPCFMLADIAPEHTVFRPYCKAKWKLCFFRPQWLFSETTRVHGFHHIRSRSSHAGQSTRALYTSVPGTRPTWTQELESRGSYASAWHGSCSSSSTRVFITSCLAALELGCFVTMSA